MKYWEKIKEPITKTESSVWGKAIWIIGFLIGLTIIGMIVVLVYLLIGLLFSLLWNFAVAPVFGVTELTTYTGAALLFLISIGVRVVKWVFN